MEIRPRSEFALSPINNNQLTINQYYYPRRVGIAHHYSIFFLATVGWVSSLNSTEPTINFLLFIQHCYKV